MLVQLIQGEDEEVAAIACFDLGEFAKEYPSGRAILKRFGVQQLLFGLIEHENVDLQRQALQAASKILIQNWQVRSAKSSGRRVVVI
jgi:V-type H+-transporting ATPase subunit H